MTNSRENEQVLKEIMAGKYRDCYLIYNRKSTDEPDNQKNSIKYQKAENGRFVERERLNVAGCTLKGFCKEGIISEKHSAFYESDDVVITSDGKVQYGIERPKFHQLCRFLNMGLFKGVIFLCYDRAIRNKGDDVVIRKLARKGADVRYAWATYDNSSSGELHKDVDGMMSEHISRVTREKVIKTTRELRAKGIVTFKAPIGYLNLGNMDEKPFDPERAPILKKVFEMYAAGDWSMADLTRWANDHGLTMPPMRRRRTEEEILEEDDDDDAQSHIPKVSRPIRIAHLQRILSNPFYTGMIKDCDGNWVSSRSHKALIDGVTYRKVQDVRKWKKVSMYYDKKLDLQFRGIFRCNECKRVYTPYIQKGTEYLGARCRTGCLNNNKNFPLRYLAGQVGDVISKLALTDNELAELDARDRASEAVSEDRRQEFVDQHKRREKKVTEDLAYLTTNKLVLLKAGVYTPESYVEEEIKLNMELASMQADEKISTVSMEAIVGDTKKLSELLKDVAGLYDSMNLREKEHIAHLAFSELTIAGNTLKYKCKNGLQFFADRFDPVCAPKKWLSELLRYGDYIKASLNDLELFIQQSIRNNLNKPSLPCPGLAL